MNIIENTVLQSAANLSVPGFVAMATQGGETICEVAAGSLDHDGAVAMTADAVFWIASMTKAVTAVAAMQLVEAGKLDLDAPLGRVLPSLATVRVLDGFADDGAPILRAPKRPVTLAHLLSHTSGFAYTIWNTELTRYVEAAGVPDLGTGLNAALDLPLMFDPGERWEYGVGIDIAGKVVEAVSGQPLDAYFADHIMAPLGLTDTVFRPTPSMRGRLAGMTMRTPDGAVASLDLPLNPEPEFWGGGGGLYSTAADYLVFLGAFMNGGAGSSGRILRPETVARMTAHRIAPVPLRKLATANAFLSHDLDMSGGSGDAADWGLSFLVNTGQGPHGRAAGSLAWAGLANTYYWADPEHRVAGVLMSQLLPFADPQIMSLFHAFEAAVYA